MPDWMPEALFAAGVATATLLAYRFGSSTRRSAASRRVLARAGTAATLVAVAVGSSAAGIVFRERPAGERAPGAAQLLLAIAVVVLACGFALRAGANRRRDIRVVGTRGRAYVRSIEEAGPGMKGIPVWELDVDVEAPGTQPFRTTVREAIPRVMAETIRPESYVTVLVDDQRGVAVDWVASRDPGFGAGFTPDDEAATRPPPPLLQEQPLAAVASPSIVQRVVRLVLPMAVLAATGGLVGLLAGPSDDAPVTVRPGTYESTPFGERVSGIGYSFAVPPGWRESATLVLAVAPGANVEVALESPSFVRAALTVSRLRREKPGTKLERLLPLLAREAGGDAVGAASTVLDGERALELDVAGVGGVRTRLVVVRHEGDVLVVSLRAFEGDWSGAEPALADVLGSWQWE